MKFSDLPKSELVGFATDPESLADLLGRAMTIDTVFNHFDRAVDGPRSCRLLFREPIVPFTDTCPLSESHTCTAAAWQFFNRVLITQLRYDPAEAPTPKHKKGWEIRKVIHDGQGFVIALTAWVE